MRSRGSVTGKPYKSSRSEPFLFTTFTCHVQSLTQMEREKIVWEFEQLYHSLKEHEYRLLARLEELDLAIYNSINGAITQFSCNISHLSGLIAQLEEKQQQPTRELLQVSRTALQTGQLYPCQVVFMVPFVLCNCLSVGT